MFIIAKNVSAWWLEHQSARGYISTDKMTIDIPRKLKTSLLPSFVSIGSWFPSWWRAKRDLENRSSRKLWHERPTVNRSETWRWKKDNFHWKEGREFWKGWRGVPWKTWCEIETSEVGATVNSLRVAPTQWNLNQSKSIDFFLLQTQQKRLVMAIGGTPPRTNQILHRLLYEGAVTGLERSRGFGLEFNKIPRIIFPSISIPVVIF